eukprot:g277.t1
MGGFQSVEDLNAHGDLSTFNIQDGFVEAIVRGYRKGFLTDAEYFQLRGAKSLSDVRLNLQDTDYAGFLDDEAELTTGAFKEKATLKFATEFKYMRSQANEPLATFLDYISYEYMINNIILILETMLQNPDSDTEIIMSRCHPLGQMSERTMKLIASFKNSKRMIDELVQNVLVNTPVGKYFEQYLSSLTENERLRGGAEVQGILSEKNYNVIEHHVMRLYLEDFYRFVQTLGGETAEIMGNLLKVRADQRSINIVRNSFSWELGTERAKRESDRQALLPSFGMIYPQGTALMKDVKKESDLTTFLKKYKAYSRLWEVWADLENKDDDSGGLDDGWYHFMLELYETAFLGQCNYAPFYAFVKLKEQEVRNLVYICECIQQRQKDKIGLYIPIFSPSRGLMAWSKMETKHRA